MGIRSQQKKSFFLVSEQAGPKLMYQELPPGREVYVTTWAEKKFEVIFGHFWGQKMQKKILRDREPHLYPPIFGPGGSTFSFYPPFLGSGGRAEKSFSLIRVKKKVFWRFFVPDTSSNPEVGSPESYGTTRVVHFFKKKLLLPFFSG